MVQQSYSATQSPQDTKPDRTLAMTCTPTLVWNADGSIGATAVYTYNPVGSRPDMTGRVHADGDILLHPLPDPQSFSNNVDVTITLDTSQMHVNGGTIPVEGRWAESWEYSGKGPVTGFCWFCRVQNVARRDYDKTPITIPGMTPQRLSNSQILIDDDTPGSAPDYAYCLGLVLPGYDNYYITLDPIITGKGSGTNPPFMLKG